MSEQTLFNYIRLQIDTFNLETYVATKKQVLQQDSAPSHANKVIQANFREATPQFIKKDEWSSQSTADPMEYAIRDFLKEKVH